VDLLCKVCDETINCMNIDVYIRIDTPEDHAKCHQMRQV
jgi:primosomal protein N'